MTDRIDGTLEPKRGWPPEDEWQCPNCSVWNDDEQLECGGCGCVNPEAELNSPLSDEEMGFDQDTELKAYITMEVLRRGDGLYIPHVVYSYDLPPSIVDDQEAHSRRVSVEDGYESVREAWNVALAIIRHERIADFPKEG